jgi:predicted RecA/RadA family phage recombinase
MAYANVNANTKSDVSDVITVTAPAAVVVGDLFIVGPWLCMALNKAASGAAVSVDIKAGLEIDAVSTVSVAATVGAAIYYNPTTGAFAAATATGNALVGYTTVVKNSDNVFRFEKVRYATVA